MIRVHYWICCENINTKHYKKMIQNPDNNIIHIQRESELYRMTTFKM